MGFVERRISPRTIADIVLAQIQEGQGGPLGFAEGTLSGLMEVTLPLSYPREDAESLVVFFASQPGFPESISLRASLFSLIHCLQNPALFKYHEALAKRLLASKNKIAETLEAPLLMKCAENIRTWLISVQEGLPPNPHGGTVAPEPPSALENLWCVLTNEPHTLGLRKRSKQFSANDVFHEILRISKDNLAQLSYQSFPICLKEQQENWKIKNLHRLTELPAGTSQEHAVFLTQWFFDDVLKSPETAKLISLREEFIHLFLDPTWGEAFLKGISQCVQQSVSTHFDSMTGQHHAYCYFNSLVQIWPQKGFQLQRSFLPWALDYARGFPAEKRLITRANIQWLRCLGDKIGADDWGAPPPWVVQNAAVYGALIFDLAPGFWLQRHGVEIVRRLCLEVHNPPFQVTSEHYNYVEYLVRKLKKKSPYFAVKPHTLAALAILRRLSANESQQWDLTAARLRLGINPQSLSQAPISQHDQVFWKGFFDDYQRFEKGILGHPIRTALGVIEKMCAEAAAGQRQHLGNHTET